MGINESTKQHVYRVKFFQKDIWPDYKGNDNDVIEVDVFQSWFKKSSEKDFLIQKEKRNHDIHHPEQHHQHSHDHSDHQHDERAVIEQTAVDKEGPYALGQQFSEIFLKVLFTKKIVTEEEIRMIVELVESIGTNNEGPRIVARAWKDPEFKKRLLENANTACIELGIVASNSHASTYLKVVENTNEVHNLIVCTLCSCYPMNILGVSPSWYKSRSYRARAVKEPRKLLQEFGTYIAEEKSIRVHDSNSDLRFMVLPQIPKGKESLSEEALIKLVTRDSLIGVSLL